MVYLCPFNQMYTCVLSINGIPVLFQSIVYMCPFYQWYTCVLFYQLYTSVISINGIPVSLSINCIPVSFLSMVYLYMVYSKSSFLSLNLNLGLPPAISLTLCANQCLHYLPALCALLIVWIFLSLVSGLP